MSNFLPIGERLRAERERLGLNQTDFAALGGIGRKTQFNYESGERSPDGAYLSAIAAGGADINYILTGQRQGAPVLTPDERQLVEMFRAAPLAVKAAAIGALQGGSLGTTKDQTFHARVGKVIKVDGNVSGDFVVGKKG